MDFEIIVKDRNKFFTEMNSIFNKYPINKQIPKKYFKWKNILESGIIRNAIRFSICKRIKKNHYSISLSMISCDHASDIIIDTFIDFNQMITDDISFKYNEIEYDKNDPDIKKIITDKINEENIDFLNMINNNYHYLETELSALNNTIYFDNNNLSVFGVKTYQMILSSANLFEQCAKRLARNDYSSMTEWKKTRKINEMADIDIMFLPINGMKLDHVKSLSLSSPKTPEWWDVYNDIKHRFSFKNASLENALNSIASAGLIVNEVTKEMDQKNDIFAPEESKLFWEIYTYFLNNVD